MYIIKDDLYVYTLPKDRYAKLNEKIEEFKDNPEIKKKYELWKKQEELMELYEIKTYLSDVGFIIDNDKITNYHKRLEEIKRCLSDDFIDSIDNTVKRFYKLNNK